MATRKLSRSIWGILLVVSVITGCADEYFVLHSETGDPLLISRRSYTSEGCVTQVKEDATRLGVTFRYINVRGTFVGRSLLWPIEPGYSCEAAIGPKQQPSGTYPMKAEIFLRG